jgi:hypothetical protein
VSVPADDPRFPALIELLRRTGAAAVQIRYSDDEQPTVWMAVGDWTGEASTAGADGHEAAAALDPLTALMRLADQVIDGARCVHCTRPSAVDHDWTGNRPLRQSVCWYVFDPEMKTYRRSCEGRAKAGRNDPCPCGSGLKLKRCHGRSKGGEESGSMG